MVAGSSWGWGQFRNTELGMGLASLIMPPVALSEQAPDLANRAVPRANCDDRPFVANVLITGSELEAPVALSFKANCTADERPLGLYAPGVPHQISLPAAGQVEATWFLHPCESGIDATHCGANADQPDLEIQLAGRDGDPLQVTVRDESGAALAGAWVGTTLAPLGTTTNARGLAEFPRGVTRFPGFQTGKSLSAVDVRVDGVSRHIRSGDNDHEIIVDLDAPVLRGTVTGPSGQPVAGAKVSCINRLTPWASAVAWATNDIERNWWNTTYSDEQGLYGCSFLAGDGWTYDRRVEASELGVTRHESQRITEFAADVVMAPSKTVVVGCAGLEGDDCKPVGRSVVCKQERDDDGRDGDPCERKRAIDGTSELQCTCVEGQDGVQAGPNGTRLGIQDTLWIDFRDVTGGVQGRVPEIDGARPECSVIAYGMSVHDQRYVRTDADGHFELGALGAGAWQVQALCGEVELRRWVEVSDEVLRLDFELSDRT